EVGSLLGFEGGAVRILGGGTVVADDVAAALAYAEPASTRQFVAGPDARREHDDICFERAAVGELQPIVTLFTVDDGCRALARVRSEERRVGREGRDQAS